MIKKLSKKKNDVKFIRIVDGVEVVCSFNQCIDKFQPSSHEITRTPNWNENQPITSETFFWECSECGKKVNAKGDRTKSWLSYRSAIINGNERS